MTTIADTLSAVLECYQAGLYPRAEELCRQILAQEPAHAAALHLLGLIARRVGQRERAVELVQQALALKPDFAEAHYNLGVVLHECGRYREAVQAYQRCLQLLPDDAEAHFNLAITLRELDQHEAAVAEFRETLRIAPQNAEALNNLGSLFLSLDRPTEALTQFERAVQLHPDFAVGYVNLATTLRRLGRPDEAAVATQKAERLQLRATDSHHAGAAQMPVVSVVIPCFNSADFLGQAIASAQQQHVPCQIIVVDDGSTDDSLPKARALLGNDPLHFVVAQSNQGPAAARNTGLSLAKGEFVCFLDADDQLAPDFCWQAVQVLTADPKLVAVCSQIELVDCHREVLTWQRESIEATVPSNLLVRTDVARQIGGFPVDPAYRGQAATEDCEFRRQLIAQGLVAKIERPLVKYRVRRGSHFDFFLDRAFFRDGQVQVSRSSKEEADGSLAMARRRYQEAIQERKGAQTIAALKTTFEEVSDFLRLAGRFRAVEGFLQPAEGFALYWLARHWPVNGRTVEIGSFKGRSTCWLATGCQKGGYGPLAAVDRFTGSPEHQRGGSHEDADIVAHGSTLPVFRKNLEHFELAEGVTVHAGSSTAMGSEWNEPIRLLFIDGDHSYEASQDDFQAWARHVVAHGLIIFHDIQIWPGVTRFYHELCSQTERWRSIGCYWTLGVIERLD